MGLSPFQKALESGLASKERFVRITESLGDDFKIATVEDARALAAAVVSLAGGEPDLKLTSKLSTVIQLLQDVGSKEAFAVLQAEAMPSLERLFDQKVDSKPKDLKFLLKLFAMYRRPEGFSRIALAIRLNVDCGWFWVPIFSGFHEKNPLLKDFLEIPLTDFPPNFARVALVDQVNQLALKALITRHPFDCEAGKVQLEEWLADRNPKHFSYARSVAVALPFISAPERTTLLALAMDHASSDVQLEAAWAATKVGNPGGVTYLARACTDPALAKRAAKYLAELGREDAIPVECTTPDFTAEAAVRSWLAHPNEFGRQPDELSLFDTRVIFWPPAKQDSRVHLFRYRYAAKDAGKPDTLGVVMTGGVTTFSLVTETTAEMSAEDVYAVHCCWELQMQKDPRAPKTCTPAAGRKILEEA
jgi:hypothetical protein